MNQFSADAPGFQMKTDNFAVKDAPSALQHIHSDANDNNVRLRDIVRGLNETVDKAFGSSPEAPLASSGLGMPQRPQRFSGGLGQVEAEGIETAFLLDQLSDLVRKLSTLA